MLVVILILFAGSSIGFIRGAEEATLLVASIASLAITLFPVIVNRSYIVFQPMTFIAFSVAMGCTLKSFYIIAYQGSNEIVDKKLLLDLGLPSLSYGATAIAVGLFFCVFGYMFAGRDVVSRKIKNRYVWDTNRLTILSCGVIFISLVGFLGFIALNGISIASFDDLSVKRFRDDDGAVSATRSGSLDYLLYRLALLAKIPLYVLFLFKIKSGFRWASGYGFLLIISGLISLFVPFFFNNRAGILLPVLDLLMIYYLTTRNVNIRVLLILGGSASVLVFFGSLIRSGGDLGRAYDVLFGGRYLLDITKTAHIISHYTNYEGLFYGQTMLNWVYKLVPFIAPDELEFQNIGRYLGFEVFGYLNSGVPPGILAELYMNFGYPGIVIGMFIVGYSLKKIHRHFISRIDSPKAIILYAIICTRFTIFLFNNGISIAILKTVLDVVVIYIAMSFVFKLRTRSRA